MNREFPRELLDETENSWANRELPNQIETRIDIETLFDERNRFLKTTEVAQEFLQRLQQNLQINCASLYSHL